MEILPAGVSAQSHHTLGSQKLDVLQDPAKIEPMPGTMELNTVTVQLTPDPCAWEAHGLVQCTVKKARPRPRGGRRQRRNDPLAGQSIFMTNRLTDS